MAWRAGNPAHSASSPSFAMAGRRSWGPRSAICGFGVATSFRLETSGGGGFGDKADRPEADVADGSGAGLHQPLVNRLRDRRGRDHEAAKRSTVHEAGGRSATTRPGSTVTLSSVAGLTLSGSACVLHAFRSASCSVLSLDQRQIRKTPDVCRHLHRALQIAVEREQCQAFRRVHCRKLEVWHRRQGDGRIGDAARIVIGGAVSVHCARWCAGPRRGHADSCP